MAVRLASSAFSSRVSQSSSNMDWNAASEGSFLAMIIFELKLFNFTFGRGFGSFRNLGSFIEHLLGLAQDILRASFSADAVFFHQTVAQIPQQAVAVGCAKSDTNRKILLIFEIRINADRKDNGALA